MSNPFLRHELEGGPAFAPHGRLELRGWCLAENSAPSVRLKIAGLQLEPAERFARPDVAATLGLADPGPVGFRFAVWIAAGCYIAVLEARVGESWQGLRRFTVTSSVPPLAGAIEHPTPAGQIAASVRVQGWCAHPALALTKVELSYGNVRLPCRHGLERTDVPHLVPTSPDAERAGFIAAKNLPASRGRLRVRAVDETGRVHFLHPDLTVDVVQDEDRAEPLRLPATAPTLGEARRVAPPHQDKAPGGPALRILFALYGDFTSNSAIHVMNLARELVLRGHVCTVAVPQHPETASYFPPAGIRTCAFADVAASEDSYDVVHGWTTRENVRQLCAALQARGRIAHVAVHLEDNELRILELTLGRSVAELRALPPAELDKLVPPELSHPIRSGTFLQNADGVSVIIDTLRAHVPAGLPTVTLWPAADITAFFPRPRPMAFRAALGWSESHIVLFYHGNVHAANRAEVRELYGAVEQLNANGHTCTLVRAGRSDAEFVASIPSALRDHVIELGQISPHRYLGLLLALADYFVQPGEPDEFNDYRLPSKLPEFFALGRPVILPRTNLGRLVRHGVDAYVLDRADAGAIAGAVTELQANPELRERLSSGALEFSRRHFDWRVSARQLEEFYRGLLAEI